MTNWNSMRFLMEMNEKEVDGWMADEVEQDLMIEAVQRRMQELIKSLIRKMSEGLIERSKKKARIEEVLDEDEDVDDVYVEFDVVFERLQLSLLMRLLHMEMDKKVNLLMKLLGIEKRVDYDVGVVVDGGGGVEMIK